jgi:hypothetical protein
MVMAVTREMSMTYCFFSSLFAALLLQNAHHDILFPLSYSRFSLALEIPSAAREKEKNTRDTRIVT